MPDNFENKLTEIKTTFGARHNKQQVKKLEIIVSIVAVLMFVVAFTTHNYHVSIVPHWVSILICLFVILLGGIALLLTIDKTLKAEAFWDREYFTRCIEKANNESQLEQSGLVFSENLVEIAIDKIAVEWDIFGPLNGPRERLLVELHKIANLREIADSIDCLSDKQIIRILAKDYVSDS